MGYESVLHLVDIKVGPSSVPQVREAVKNTRAISDSYLQMFVSMVGIDGSGFLCFRPWSDQAPVYVPDEEGLVPALNAKWNHDELIAAWVAQFAESGRVILHSREADGAAWGWEFDGKGGARELQMKSVGRWKHLRSDWPLPEPGQGKKRSPQLVRPKVRKRSKRQARSCSATAVSGCSAPVQRDDGSGSAEGGIPLV